VTPLDRLAGRRILFVNWRDHTHPQAGGAEVYCEELARSFASAGAEVTLFTSRYGDVPVTELHRGVRYVRSGRTFDVYVRAATYMRERRREFDAVIDFQNGIPFFAPLFTGPDVATVCVIHHVHQTQFALHFPKPVAAVGRMLEGPVARLVYGMRPVVAVSPSTRDAVRRALRLRGPIHVVPNGLVAQDGADRQPTAEPRIAVVTRLVPQKRIDLLVRAAGALRARFPSLQVDVAGGGPSAAGLAALVAELGLEDTVHLHGRVSDERRDEIWRRAWLTVAPSVQEGWGLTVLEANQWGVPCVAFDVPGLRDAVIDGTTGWLVGADGSLEQTVGQALDALADRAAAEAMGERCRAWSARFSWQDSARRLAAVVDAEIARTEAGRGSRRTPGDQATVARFTVDDDRSADEAESWLLSRLRRTDDVSRHARSFTVLLKGSDEVEAAAALADLPDRAGLAEPPRLQVAQQTDLLSLSAGELAG
jgi:glycosyltransferase involved in cell wall biosynthesis